MSGDGHPKDQPLIFYSKEMTIAKQILMTHGEPKTIETNGVTVQPRWRTGSPMQG